MQIEDEVTLERNLNNVCVQEREIERQSQNASCFEFCFHLKEIEKHFLNCSNNFLCENMNNHSSTFLIFLSCVERKKCNQHDISPTFYEQFFLPISVHPKIIREIDMSMAKIKMNASYHQ